MDIYNLKDKTSYTLGMSISIELLINHPEIVTKVYYSSRMIKNDNYHKLQDLCLRNNIPLINDDKVIDNLSVKENCYVIAVFNKFYSELKSNNHLVLMNYDDEGALGTVLRTAISFNHRDIILINSNIDYFEPKVVRASMGAIFYTNIKKYPDLDSYLMDYPRQNIYSIANDGKKELNEISYKEPYSLIYSNDYMNGIDIGEKVYIKHHNYESIPQAMVFAISLHHFYNLKHLI